MSSSHPAYSPPFFCYIYESKVPNDWSWKFLSEVSQPQQWGNISKTELTESGFPVYGANGHIGFFSDFNHAESVIAISCRGSCGDVHKTKPFSYVSSNAMCIDNLSQNIDQDFLYYALCYRSLEDAISGSAQPQITRENLQKVVFPTPPLPEQKKIASILTSVDKVIENTQKQIDKLQDLKKATMNELLTKGIGHTEFKDSELGRIPKSWEVRTIGESCDIKNTLRLPISREEREKIRGNYRYYGPTGILDYINEYRLEGEYTLIGEDGDHFIKFYEKPQSIYVTGKFNVNNHAHILEGNAVVSARWVYWFFLHRDIGPALTRQGAGRYKLNKDSLQKLEISIPPMMEQVEIDVKLKCFDTLIRSKTKKLSQTQSLKKSLMQDLLTGKVRVTVN